MHTLWFHRYRASILAAFALAALLVLTPACSTATDFDHSVFDALLKRSVSNGRINYALFRNNAQFNSYIASIGTASLNGKSANEKLAFWLNAYNALVIKNVLAHPGMRKPTDIKGFFDGAKFRVNGRQMTLNDIENKEIRPVFNEPLIHFGLVCAAVNCPPIIPEAYKAATVRAKLADNARKYLADSRYNRYDASKKRLQLSKIFEWYASDFGGTQGTLVFVSRYGTPQMKSAIAGGGVKLAFLEYDWNINAR